MSRPRVSEPRASLRLLQPLHPVHRHSQALNRHLGPNLRRGRSYIDCGCGDRSMHQPISRRMVLRNAVIAAVLMASIWLPAPDVAQNAAVLPALALALVCFILYLGNEALAMVLSRPRKRLSPSLARLAWSRFPEEQR